MTDAQLPAGWQPIETAPKDGTYIVVARAGEDIGLEPMEITSYFRVERDVYEEAGNGLFRKERRVVHEGWNNNGHRATHWMPLPPPPAREG